MELRVLLLIVAAGLPYAQSAETHSLEVNFKDKQPRRVSVGASLKFECTLNRGPMYVIHNNLEVVHKSAVDDKETVFSQGGKKLAHTGDQYTVVIEEGPDQSMIVKFEISEVRDEDEGTFICRAGPTNIKEDSETAEDHVKVTVLRPLDVLYLKFDNLDAITQDKFDPIEIDSGVHTVACIAEGSNPPPDNIHLYLEGLEIKANHTPPEMIGSNFLKYRTTISAAVPLTVANTNQKFQCTASSELGDSHSVKLPIKMKVYEPHTVCNNSKAYRGERYPVLTCTVDYEGMKIKNFKYELANGDSVNEGDQNDDFVEVKREQLSDTKARVTLNLYRAEDWHFESPFFLVAEHEDGHSSRASVRLEEVPEIGAYRGNGSSVFGTSVVILIMMLCALVTL